MCAGIKSLSNSFLRVNKIIKPVKESTRQTKNTISSIFDCHETDALMDFQELYKLRKQKGPLARAFSGKIIYLSYDL